MKFLLPFSGAVAEAIGTISEKIILTKKKVDYKAYNVLGFFAISLIILLMTFAFGKVFPSVFAFRVDAEALSFNNILLMAIVIFISILANLFTFYSFKWEKLTELQPMRILQPLLVIILAFVFYDSERVIGNKIIIASFIAAFALFFSHVKKNHFSLNKYGLAALLGSLFFAIELVISKSILSFYTPLTFYFIRCFFIFATTFIFFRPSFSSVNKKVWRMIILTGFIWVTYRLFLYLGYIYSGVIITTLTLSLVTPIFVYMLSYFFLKEKPTWRNILASAVILACVIWASL